jgi:two-component system, LytTR family, sensor kinase
MSSTMRTSRVVALALLVGVFFTAEEVLMDMAGQRSQLAGRDVLNGAIFWAVWAALTPLALAAVRRWPLGVAPVSLKLIANIAAAVALSAVHNVISYGLQLAIDRPEYSFARILRGAATGTPFVWGLFTGVVFYSVIVMVDMAERFRRLYAAELIEAAALKQELTQTKLDTLRSQLQPHFLFNTLNAIAVFVKEDSARAEHMILRLAALLRRSLDESEHEIPLERELIFVNDYLDIQQGRFGDRLAVRLSIDPDVLRARVPVFLLQPMLENAIEHGRSNGRCTIDLHVRRDAEMLDISLTDGGAGVSRRIAARERIGLGNTRQRLFHLYGPHASIDLGRARENAGSGGRVHIRIPFRMAPS